MNSRCLAHPPTISGNSRCLTHPPTIPMNSRCLARPPTIPVNSRCLAYQDPCGLKTIRRPPNPGQFKGKKSLTPSPLSRPWSNIPDSMEQRWQATHIFKSIRERIYQDIKDFLNKYVRIKDRLLLIDWLVDVRDRSHSIYLSNWRATPTATNPKVMVAYVNSSNHVFSFRRIYIIWCISIIFKSTMLHTKMQ